MGGLASWELIRMFSVEEDDLIISVVGGSRRQYYYYITNSNDCQIKIRVSHESGFLKIGKFRVPFWKYDRVWAAYHQYVISIWWS